MQGPTRDLSTGGSVASIARRTRSVYGGPGAGSRNESTRRCPDRPMGEPAATLRPERAARATGTTPEGSGVRVRPRGARSGIGQPTEDARAGSATGRSARDARIRRRSARHRRRHIPHPHSTPPRILPGPRPPTRSRNPRGEGGERGLLFSSSSRTPFRIPQRRHGPGSRHRMATPSVAGADTCRTVAPDVFTPRCPQFPEEACVDWS